MQALWGLHGNVGRNCECVTQFSMSRGQKWRNKTIVEIIIADGNFCSNLLWDVNRSNQGTCVVGVSSVYTLQYGETAAAILAIHLRVHCAVVREGYLAARRRLIHVLF